jgi:aryl-alcohol dehydrogenase-like predicted oxidoreductase
VSGHAITRRPFGRTDLIVSEFGLGCARIGGIFQREPLEFLNLLSRAFDSGINFFDTADIYSQGESERILGRAFRGRRDQIVIASKAGYVLPAQRRLVARLKPLVRPALKLLRLRRDQLPSAVRGALAQDFSPAHLTRAVEGSLQRLGTDHLDLFQLHSPPTDVVEAGAWIAALEALKREGKIRYYGISCDSAEAAQAALSHPGVSSIQIVVNLLERDAIETVLPRAHSQGTAIIARECLANGLLAKDASAIDFAANTRSAAEAERKAAQVASYRQVARTNGCSLAHVALQFVSRLEGVSVSLVGVSVLSQLEGLLSDGTLAADRGEMRGIPAIV